ncbi:hypothetical protein GALMADRAFT_747111 [Galerina marginata CBS 339.88]|uniref:Uncharacterized protein n=1 Tax=Galerina marginata (strain CBS 339.88) TaxID=685588 RepID=A0A067SZF9_GALM3|nr:hypothetical protein GALMADRAFT_747111 [Galerina marginata CBS 339.88]
MIRQNVTRTRRRFDHYVCGDSFIQIVTYPPLVRHLGNKTGIVKTRILTCLCKRQLRPAPNYSHKISYRAPQQPQLESFYFRINSWHYNPRALPKANRYICGCTRTPVGWRYEVIGCGSLIDAAHLPVIAKLWHHVMVMNHPLSRGHSPSHFSKSHGC